MARTSKVEDAEPRGVRDGVGASRCVQLVEKLTDVELGRVHRDVAQHLMLQHRFMIYQ